LSRVGLDAPPGPRYNIRVISRRLWVLSAFLLFAGALGYAWHYHWRDHRFDPVILAAATRYEVEPSLVKAVVWQESRFDPEARGRAGETGLMQVRELAALEWTDSEGMGALISEQLADPGTNTLAGAWYLAKLLKRYQHTDNPPAYALADYNAGRSNVLRWNKGAAATNGEAFIQQIDFPGTRRYVRAVLLRREHYQPAFDIQ